MGQMTGFRRQLASSPVILGGKSNALLLVDVVHIALCIKDFFDILVLAYRPNSGTDHFVTNQIEQYVDRSPLFDVLWLLKI
jgi:hypothetical protein